jgi:prephenate dehydrogenase
VTGPAMSLQGVDTIAVVGLGLMGGSLARDLAAQGHRVIGADANEGVVEAALAEGVIAGRFGVGEAGGGGSAGGGTAGSGSGWGSGAAGGGGGVGTEGRGGGVGVAEAGLVVVATPVRAAIPVVRWLAGAARDDAVITDLGSTKRSIVEAASAAGLGGRFVGGHPMAGDHRSGWSASRQGLFIGADVWLCPAEPEGGAGVGNGAGPVGATGGGGIECGVALVEGLWEGVGARPRRIDAVTHDHVVAWTSHLPQLLVTALGRALNGAGVDRSRLGPGGRETTRLAGSDPAMWTDILVDNADALEPALDALLDELVRLRRQVAGLDDASLRAALDDARRWAAGEPGP